MQGELRPAAPPRRVEALAFIIGRIRSGGTSPSYGEIGRAMNPQVDRGRARQYVDQLVKLGVIDRDPGAQRGIRVRDLGACCALIDSALGAGGWWHAARLAPLSPPDPYTLVQLPISPPFRHLPDIE